MALYQKGILGSFSGKVGHVIGARWRGKNVMRSLPHKSRKPASQAQLEQRAKFALVSKFFNPIKAVLNAYYGQEQGPLSRLNLAMSYHLKEAVVGTYPVYSLDFSKLIFSKGALLGFEGLNLVLDNQELQFSWLDNSGRSNAEATDQMLLLLYNEQKNLLSFFDGVAVRSAASFTHSLATLAVGETLHVWVALRSENAKLVSTSDYLGSFSL